MKKLKFITGVSRAALLLFFLCVSFEGYSQLITNPSFEGHPAAMNQAPFPWAPCKTFSTPDTQPGVWDVSTPPSHGIAFLGLVTRGNLGPYANTTEAAQVQLTTKLKSKSKYAFSIDLAFSTSLGHFGDQDFVSYASPTILKVWGGVNSCEKTELLWKSPEINHTNWQTYDFTIVPQSQEISYLILEVDYVALPTYFGNILIDNIVEKKSPDPTSCIVETFNVFTPNGDGYNDVFHIKSANDIAKFKLQIYNRWGNLVFETKDFRQGWDGTHKGDKCPAGIYFWNIHYMCIEGNSIGEYKRRGSLTLLN